MRNYSRGKKENWRTQEIGKVWNEDGKQDLESAEKIKQENVRRRGRAEPHKVGLTLVTIQAIVFDVMCWYAPHYRNYSVEIHAYNRRYSIVAAWAYTIYAVE